MMAVMAVVLFGAIGASVDFGRVFIAKHEAQIYTDSAALAAALQLDGTSEGSVDAVEVVTNSTNSWNLGTQAFSGTTGSHTVMFATSAAGPWSLQSALPNPPTGYKYVRVTASVTVPLFFLGAVVPATSQTVNATSLAGQAGTASGGTVSGTSGMTKIAEGAFPFTPRAFDANDPTVGFTVDQQYTIRYPASGTSACAGDPGRSKDKQDRGYWGDNSANIIEKRIVDDYQSGAVAIIGQDINLAGGAKTTESTYLDERSNQDPDQTSMTYADYKTRGTGNGRRLVVMPITDYDIDPNEGIALGFATFLLLPSGNYGHTGNSSWCAVYVGPGTMNQPMGGASTTAGAYRVGLIQ
jgi:Flp pilus assembly protein TadG